MILIQPIYYNQYIPHLSASCKETTPSYFRFRTDEVTLFVRWDVTSWDFLPTDALLSSFIVGCPQRKFPCVLNEDFRFLQAPLIQSPVPYNPIRNPGTPRKFYIKTIPRINCANKLVMVSGNIWLISLLCMGNFQNMDLFLVSYFFALGLLLSSWPTAFCARRTST